MLKRMFVVICLTFNTHASDVSITGQASEVLQRFRSRAAVKSHVAGAIREEVKASCVESQGLHSIEPVSIASVKRPSQQDADTEQHGAREQQLEVQREHNRQLESMLEERNREITTLHAILAHVQSEEEEAPATPCASTRD